MTGAESSRIRSIGLGAIVALALVACDETNNPFRASQSGGTDAAPRSVELVERDVEAPQVFQVTDEGLWDGRPSLGGVWVAHPDVQDPERVIIRNEANGRFVIGALFRRERDNPGPMLQVSSDAADALGMLAGAPATLNVTALRREEAPAPQTTAAVTDFDAPAAIETTPIDPIAQGAAAAIADAEAAETPVAAVAGTASALEKPFIQIGIFSIGANASGTADQLRAIGLTPTVLEQTSQGRTFWRVLLGPAQTAEERAALLDQVKALGFSDAYFVTN